MVIPLYIIDIPLACQEMPLTPSHSAENSSVYGGWDMWPFFEKGHMKGHINPHMPTIVILLPN